MLVAHLFLQRKEFNIFLINAKKVQSSRVNYQKMKVFVQKISYKTYSVLKVKTIKRAQLSIKSLRIIQKKNLNYRSKNRD